MQYYDVKLLATCGNASQWPVSELPEIIFTGRSNAGKSSLINSLTGRKKLAYTGSTPGKTVLLNFFSVNEHITFVDAPGYGYSAGNKNQAVLFSNLIDPYFRTREQLKGMVLVLDIRRKPTEDDLAMVEYARRTHLPMIAVCTKADKVSGNERTNSIRTICETLNIRKDVVIPVSNVDRRGIDLVWECLEELAYR